MKKWIIAILWIIVVLAAAGCWYWRYSHPAVDASKQQQTAKVTKGNIKSVVHSNGRVVSNLDVDIKCKASGTIITLPFDVSDVVKKGDMVLELDPIDQDRITKQTWVQLAGSKARLVIAQENLDIAQRTLATDTRRAEANLQSAEQAAKDAAAKADRVKELLANKLASQEDYDTAVTASVQAQTNLNSCRVKMDELKTQEAGLDLLKQQVILAQNQVDSDQISYDIAQDRLADTKVRAPMDGVVSARSVQIGQIIASAVSNVGGGTTILTLSDLSRIFVIASVDESDIGRAAVGQRADITADSWPGKRFEGKVVQIATAGANVSNVVIFDVKIEVSSDNKSLLKPQMTGNVDITSASKRDVLTVPGEALSLKHGRRFVTLVKPDGTSEDKEVEVGISDDARSEIASGVNEGDVVVLHKSGADSPWNANANKDKNKSASKGVFMPGGGGGGRGGR